MKLSIALKTIYSNVLFYTGLTSRALKRKKGSFLILMYHRITLPDATMQPGMYVKPDTFNLHLKYLHKNFTVLTLSSLLAHIKENNLDSFDRPACVITFDDGWKDFYDHAFPLLCKYNFPATVFLPTNFIGTKNKFWTDIYADLLLKKEKELQCAEDDVKFPEIIKQLDSICGLYEDTLEQGISVLKKLPRSQIFELLEVLAKRWGVDLVSNKRDFINWSEVAEMDATNLISFGSHTVKHEILTTISKGEVRRELLDSKETLLDKGLMASTFQSFCYPNGGYTKEITEQVRDSGYHLAVTTNDGWNTGDEDLLALNRVGIHQDMTSSVPLFASRTAEFI